MPTVLSVTLALGAYELAKHGAIVARMSAVEEMAGGPGQWTAGGSSLRQLLRRFFDTRECQKPVLR